MDGRGRLRCDSGVLVGRVSRPRARRGEQACGHGFVQHRREAGTQPHLQAAQPLQGLRQLRVGPQRRFHLRGLHWVQFAVGVGLQGE